MTRASLGKRGGIALLALFSSIAVATAMLAPSALAASCGNVETSIIDCSSANDTTGSSVVALLVTAIQVLTGAVGIVAIGALIYAGILYAAASGNSSQVAKAKELIANTVIGLVLFAGMALLLNYLIPGGLFSGNAKFGATDATEITLGGGVGAGGGSGSGSSSPGLGQTAITVASWNTLFSNKSPLANGAKSIGAKADVIGFQEVHWADKTHAYSLRDNFICNSCQFEGYMDSYKQNSSGSRPASLTIAWKKSRFSRVGSGYKSVYSKEAADGEGSAKWITWVKLKDKKTADSFYVVNTHTVASIESKGEPNSDKDRVALYKKHMDVLTTFLKGLQRENIPIIVLGDFNVNYRYDKSAKYKDFPYTRLGQIGFRSNWDLLNLSGISSSASTHGSGSRLIDYGWLWGPDAKAVSTSIGSKYGSDHHAVYFSVTIGKPIVTPSGGYQNAAIPTSLKGVRNYRDLASLNSSLIKPGVVFRSAKLQDATAEDRKALATLLAGGAIIDFRTPSVRSNSPDASISGVPNLSYPVEGVTGADGYVRAFVNSAAGRKQFGAAITKIANTQGAVLFHCTAGKDRTGWMAAMLMYIMGASDAQVMTEYLKSSDAGYEVDKSWLNAALSAARKNNGGSIMNYITSPTKGLGVSTDTIAKLKAKLGP